MKHILAGAVLAAMPMLAVAGPTVISSPNGSLKVAVNLGDSISYSVSKDGRMLVDKINIALIPEGGAAMGVKPKVKKTSRKEVRNTLVPVVPMKHSEIDNNYNSATLQFAGGYSVEFRVFDNGVAHRFITTGKGNRNILGEDYAVTISEPVKAHIQQPGGFKTPYEEPYSHKALADWTPEDRMATLPALMEFDDSTLLLFSESDLNDYPCMFLRGKDGNSFTSTFPKVPLEFGPDGDRSVKILKEADYIASTSASRSFPWRYIAIGTPGDILEQTLTCQLASPCQLEDTSWIKPGSASWEWWNGATPYGEDVDFESGFNMNTYKYFIDFAARNGIPYIIMDEGWAKSTTDPYTPNPEVNVHEIVRYGKEKGVGVFLWLTWLTVENNFDLFKTFSDWGISGLKIDFMDRSDQWMVDFYERVCREAAANGLLVDFHGAFKPAGLEQKYPNLLAYEGVLGMEQMGACTPNNTVYYPLMRNAVGPMDYTPGAMISMQPECFRSERPNSAAIGTRAYQMALFVLFESGLQMLADNPTLYYKNQDCTDFIASVPNTWDETRALPTKTGEYVFMAKRKGDTWYIGGITNGDGKFREIALPLDFLDGATEYEMTSFEDGVNSYRQAMDYRRKVSTVKGKDVLNVKVARNGGFAAVLKPKK